MGSSRLPQKHLTEAAGKSLLYWLIKRFEYSFDKEIKSGGVQLVVASSEKPENKKFLSALEGTTCKLYQGSDNNIPLRHLQVAQHFKFSHVISIDGDDILCSTNAAMCIYKAMKKISSHNLFSISGLPLGMNLSGYSTAYLEESLNKYSEEKMETGWGRVFHNPDTWSLTLGNYDIMGDLRFTLDYQKDADFFCEVINQLKEEIVTISDEELIDFVLKNKLYEINASLKEEYWDNYNEEKKKETDEQ